MAVQVSYPGVYIDEFAPGAPIEGVGTSTAAFLGLAPSGPRNAPTLIQSWDAYQATFGGFLPGVWLAPAVFGFFANGGTTCYVTRISSATTATAMLPARGAGDAVAVTALAEGSAGNAVTIAVTDSSRSTDAVTTAMTRTIAGVSPDRLTLQLSAVGDISAGASLQLAHGADTATVTVDTVTPPAVVTLTAAIPGAADFTGGTATAPFVVRTRFCTATVSAMPDRSTLVLDSAGHGFAVGDQVRVDEGGDHAVGTVAAVSGATLTLALPLAGAASYAGGTARTADLSAGATRLRILVPGNLGVASAFPPGSLLAVTPDAGSTVFLTVVDSGGDTLQLAAPGLPAAVPLTDQAHAPTVATADFDLAIAPGAGGAADPPFRYLGSVPGSPGYWGRVESGLVTLAAPGSPGTPSAAGDTRPAAGTYPTAGGVADDRAASWTALQNDPAAYLQPLTRLHDVSLVAIPGATDPNVTATLIAHCAGLQDRFAILDCATGAGIADVTAQFAQVRSARGYAALYYPWITVRDPRDGAQRSWPPSGHLAGIYARSDSQRGVHKAPANVPVVGALGLERLLSDAEQGPLNLMGVNVLRTFPGQSQPVVWGARTTAGDLDRNWQYVNIRRLFIYLEQSIEAGIRWAVFEPNDLALWQKLKRSIGDFLTQVWRDGALFGAKPEDAFYVRIDEALNPPSTRALGRLYIEVGVVPTYPAEFIVLRIGIWDGGSEVSVS